MNAITANRTLKERADLTGLRGLAVAAVLAAHAGGTFAQGGFVGVDVFFVLSGYLIMRTLGRDLGAANGRVRATIEVLTAFAARRARRLLPALVTVTLLTLLLWSVFMPPPEAVSAARSGFAASVFASNILFTRQLSDYFAPGAENPFLHTWSLGVEGQFYAILPLLLLAFLALKVRLSVGLGVVALGSAALCAWASEATPISAFYLTPFRLWEFLCGALIALAHTTGRTATRWVRECAAGVGLALIIAAIFLLEETSAFPWPAALMPVAGAALVIAFGAHSWAGRVLSFGPLCALGLISYALYLWHWPLLMFVEARSDGPASAAAITAALALAVALAWATTRFIETPVRAWRSIPGTLIGGAAVSGLATVCAAGILLADGFPDRVEPFVKAAYAASQSRSPHHNICKGRTPADGLCRIGEGDGTPQVLLWGDSHAGALMPGVDAALKTLGTPGEVAFALGCAPLIGVLRAEKSKADQARCTAFNAAVMERLRTDADIGAVVLAARWPMLAEGQRAPGEFGHAPRLVATDGARGTPASLFADALYRTVAAIRATGRDVILVGGVPEMGTFVPQRLGRARFFGHDTPEGPHIAAVRARQRAADTALLTTHATAIVDVAAVLCRPHCRLTVGDTSTYVDDDHLSVAGALLLKDALANALRPQTPLAAQSRVRPPINIRAAALESP